MKILILFASLTLTLSACSSTGQISQSDETISPAKASIAAESSASPVKVNKVSPSPAPTSFDARTEVIWADYDPGTQGEIDRMTNAGDCLGINSYFGMTTATEESVKARTGHGNEAINKYLNEALAMAKCN